MEGVDLPPGVWEAVHRAATGEAWPPADAAAADLLLEQASREGLLPLLFAADGVPSVVREALSRRAALRRVAQARAAILARAVAEVGSCLADESFILLKGADSMYRLYPRPELRPMQDVDVLVRPDRIDAIGRRLEAAGLRRRPPDSAARAAASYYERAFLLGDVIVELHQSFLQRSRHRVDYEAIWRRRVAAAQGGPGAHVLDPADALAYHALSLAKDEFNVPLVRYVDLWLMVRAWPSAVAEAARRAREWRAARAFFGAVHQASRYFPDLADPELRALADQGVSRAARAFVRRLVLPPASEQGRTGVVTRRRQLWRKFWLMDGLGQRVAFAIEHATGQLAGRRRPRRG